MAEFYPSDWTPEQIAAYKAQQAEAAQKYKQWFESLSPIQQISLSDEQANAKAKEFGVGGNTTTTHRTKNPIDGIVEGVAGSPGSIDPSTLSQPGAPDLGGAGLGANTNPYGSPEIPGGQGHPETSRAANRAGVTAGVPTTSKPFDIRDRIGTRAQEITAIGIDATRVPRVFERAQAAQGASSVVDRGRTDFALAGDLGLGKRQRDFADKDLLDAARGNVPSAAEVQLNKGVAASIAAQSAVANSARGGVAAQMAAQRGAARAGVDMQNQAVQDAAQLRAQEQATARGMYVDAVGQARGQTLQRASVEGDLAKYQAGLEQGTNLANLQNRQAVNVLNPQLAQQSRELDDARATSLIGLGMKGDQAAGMIGLAGAELEQEYQRMLLERDLKIAGYNADAQTQGHAARMNLIGSGLGYITAAG